MRQTVSDDVRQSNFELMRIVSMLLIVAYHFAYNTSLLQTTSGFIHFVILVFMYFTIIHVNSFIVLMGYFQCDKKFKINRLISMNNSGWFYKVLFLIIFLLIGIKIETLEIVQLILPITLFNQYWYLAIYLLLCCCSPFLNFLINNMTKKQFHRLLLSLFLIGSIVPFFTGQLAFNNNKGFSLLTFCLLYCFGAYLKKFPIKKNYFFKVFSVNARRLIFIFVFILCVFLNALLHYHGEELLISEHSILKEIGRLLTALPDYDSPIIIIQTLVYFLLFESFSLKSKFINKVASCSFGVYLIHDNILVRRYLYKFFFIGNYSPTFIQIFVRITLATIIVFSICIIIEMFRKTLFSYIKNRKVSKKINSKIKEYFYSIRVDTST